MTGEIVLTAQATYPAHELEGLDSAIAKATALEARVQVDSDVARREITILISTERDGDSDSPLELAQQLAVMSEALPPGATKQASTWRRTAPLPF